MYIGLKLFGIAGFILGPLGLVIINTIVNEYKQRLNCNDENGNYENHITGI